MADINSLNLQEEASDVDFDNLPEFGGGLPTPYPGDYIFEMPLGTVSAWSKEHNDTKGDYIKLSLRKDKDTNIDNQLIIVQSPEGKFDGQPFGATFTSMIRKVKQNGVEVAIHGLAYLAKGLRASVPKGSGALGVAKAINEAVQAGSRRFGAPIEWSATCKDNAPIYVKVEQDGKIVTVQMDGQEGREIVIGCGSRYYQKDIPKDAEGKYMERFQCGNCSAELRAFANLVEGKIKPVA